jgi:O-antigen/teichoic acid export membrane protein
MAQTSAPTASAAADTAAIGIVAGAAYITMLVGVVRAVLLAKILGPMQRGVFNGVGLVTQYCGNCNIGLVHGMNKLMPLWMGGGDREGARRLQDTAFTGTLFLTGTTAGGVLLLAFGAPLGFAVQTRMGLGFGAALLLVSQGQLLLTSLLRTYGDYPLMGKALLAGCAGEFVMALSLGRLWGAAGAVLGLVLGGCLSYLWVLKGTKVRIQWRLHREEIKVLLSAGVPLLLLALADQFYRTADGAILLKMRHAQALGMYGIGLRLAAFLYNIPGAVGYVLFPRFLETYGRERDPAALRRLLLAPTIALVALVPLLSGIAFFLLGPLVAGYLSAYLPGLASMRILALGGILLGIAVPTDAFLVAVGRHRRVLVHKVIGGSIIAGATFLIARSNLDLGRTLSWVAGAACLGYATASGLSLVLALSHFRDARPAWMVVRALALGAYCVGMTLGIYWLIRQIPLPAHSWVAAFVGVALLVGVSLPVLRYAQRETLLLSRLLELVRRLRP